jgi:hypothetical protein
MAIDYAAKWREERAAAQQDMLARLERGNKPRNDSETCVSFVRGFERVKHSPASYPGNVWILDASYGGTVELVSYATPVSYRDAETGDIFVSGERYSPSTTQQLGKLTGALMDAGYKRDSKRVRLAPDTVRGGYLRRETTPFVRWTKDDIDATYPDGTMSKVLGGVWVSENGIWSITANVDTIGQADIPLIVRHRGYAVAYVIASYYGGPYVIAVSGTLPAYVRKMAVALAATNG